MAVLAAGALVLPCAGGAQQAPATPRPSVSTTAVRPTAPKFSELFAGITLTDQQRAKIAMVNRAATRERQAVVAGRARGAPLTAGHVERLREIARTQREAVEAELTVEQLARLRANITAVRTRHLEQLREGEAASTSLQDVPAVHSTPRDTLGRIR